MKLFYTVDSSVDENLMQVCPFNEQHHFTRSDGTSWKQSKFVGCGGCLLCPYCYGAEFPKKFPNYVLVPKDNLPLEKFDAFTNTMASYERACNEQTEMGIKQFKMIQNTYVKCAKCYTDEYRNKFSIKLKIWIWHNVLYHLRNAILNINSKISHIEFKISEIKYRIKNG